MGGSFGLLKANHASQPPTRHNWNQSWNNKITTLHRGGWEPCESFDGLVFLRVQNGRTRFGGDFLDTGAEVQSSGKNDRRIVPLPACLSQYWRGRTE